MKRRRNQLVAIECVNDSGIASAPFILAGGENGEMNRVAMIENFKRFYGGKWSARIAYHWRNKQHFNRWLDSGEKWKGIGSKR